MSMPKFKGGRIDVTDLCADINIALQDKKFMQNMRSGKTTHAYNADFESKYIALFKKEEGVGFMDIMTASGNEKKIKQAVSIVNTWVKFCYDNNVNFIDFIRNHIERECSYFCYSIKEIGDSYTDGFEDGLRHQGYIATISFISELIHLEEILGDDYCMKQLNRILNNSFEIAKGRIPKITTDLINKIPLKGLKVNERNILDELEALQRGTEGVFTNKKAYSKFKTGNHFLSGLIDDICIDNIEVHFEKFTKALSIGYTNRGVLLSIDKDSSIRELKTKIKHLEDYGNEESAKLIVFTKALIQFIGQKRHANMIPFKAISKELGITKNQAKNYAKRIYNISDMTFTNNFGDVKLLDK